MPYADSLIGYATGTITDPTSPYADSLIGYATGTITDPVSLYIMRGGVPVPITCHVVKDGTAIPLQRLAVMRGGVAVPLTAKPTTDAGTYRPVSYATIAEARAALGAPEDANYVTWAYGNTDLETVMASLSANDILVLPERTDPYLINSANGFMAAGVSGVDGTGTNGLKDGSVAPIVSNSRLWFEMTRARRGIIGMGPGAVIALSASSFSAPRQPILQNEPSGSQYQKAYFSAGGSMNLNGVQETLIGFDHANPFFANFTIRARDLGGISYNSIKKTGGTQTLTTIKRIHFDESWRSHAGVPNGEAGGITLNGGTYLIENCDLTPPSTGYVGGSAIMWNNNTGGTLRHVRARGTKGAMWTFWRCGGTNTFTDAQILAGQTGMNIEENLSGFALDWTDGSIEVGLGYAGNKFHFANNPVGGPATIALHGVAVSPNAYTAGAMTINVYTTTSGVARRSLISCNTAPVSCVPSGAWIN